MTEREERLDAYLDDATHRAYLERVCRRCGGVAATPTSELCVECLDAVRLRFANDKPNP